MAEEIATKLGTDIEEITMVNPYDTGFRATIDRCMQEREQGVIPDIQPVKANIADYDIIFLGFPVWFGTYAPPVQKFLLGADLSGKKIVPFCTFGSGGLDTSVKDLAAQLPDAEILPGYGVRSARVDAVPAEIDYFLKAGGFLAGEFTKLADFSDVRPVTEEESAIFDAAVGTYPMIRAKATEVSSRAVPNGTEYLFVAKDLPMNPDMEIPDHFIKVYVLAEDGKDPVFTQVLR